MIKAITFTLFIAGISAVPQRSAPDFVCPVEDIAATHCMGPKDCLYPNREDCNTFLQCTVNPDGTGTPVVMPCPAGLEWNDNQKICDWPSASTCNKVVSTPRTTKKPKTTTKKPAPSGPEFTCPREDIANTRCMCPKDCLYPNPGNCNTFIQCTVNPDGSGTPVVTPCPSGLEWNDEDKICDWPSSSTCNKVISTPTPTKHTQKTPTTPITKKTTPSGPDFTCPREDIANTGCMGPKDCLYPNPGNCNTFIQCTVNPDGSGTPVVMPCPAGLEWNDKDKICDWPSGSTCNKGQSTPSTTPGGDNDSELDLDKICSPSCTKRRAEAHPTDNTKYIICTNNNKKNSIQNCSPGLIYKPKKLSCVSQ